jgi:hypothetical protein
MLLQDCAAPGGAVSCASKYFLPNNKFQSADENEHNWSTPAIIIYLQRRWKPLLRSNAKMAADRTNIFFVVFVH